MGRAAGPAAATTAVAQCHPTPSHACCTSAAGPGSGSQGQAHCCGCWGPCPCWRSLRPPVLPCPPRCTSCAGIPSSQAEATRIHPADMLKSLCLGPTPIARAPGHYLLLRLPAARAHPQHQTPAHLDVCHRARVFWRRHVGAVGWFRTGQHLLMLGGVHGSGNWLPEKLVFVTYGNCRRRQRPAGYCRQDRPAQGLEGRVL